MTDIHCFSFAPVQKLDHEYLVKLFTLGGPTVLGVKAPPASSDLHFTLAYKALIHELAKLLKSSPEEAKVLHAREERAKHFAKYIEMLLADARLQRLVLDNGIESLTFQEFSRYVKIDLKRVFRIEPLIKMLLESAKSFTELLDDFDRRIKDSIKKEKFIGFKTVIAYRTGLDIALVNESEARADFNRYREGEEKEAWFGPPVKRLRDFLLLYTIERARELGVFVQIHTGLGDTDIIGDKCDPILLLNLLKREETLPTTIILIHGGYPYTIEAAWLSKVFPNVYFELSTAIPPTFAPAVSAERYRQVIQITPVTKIVYGSDAIELPELHWFSAKLAKAALAEALAQLVNEDSLNEEDAYEAAGMILNQNAQSLLGH